MGDPQADDPFDWDTDRLVTEFCTENRSWSAPPKSKLPDPEKFAKSLRAEELDGETLLTYDWDGSKFGGREEYDILWKGLGVTKISHKLALFRAVGAFRKRSPRFQDYHTKVLAADDPSPTESPAASSGSPGNLPEESLSLAHAIPPVEDPRALDNSTGLETHLETHISPAQAPTTPTKRRIAPEFVAIGNKRLRLDPPTEGDALNAQLADEKHESVSDDSDEVFSFVASGGPDRRSGAANRRNLQLLRPKISRNGRGHFQVSRVNQIPGHLKTSRALSQGQGIEDDGSNVLPLFGESEDEYDSETWNEILEEEEERRKEAAMPKSKALASGEVAATIEEMIQAEQQRWRAAKLPKLQEKAYGLWNKARMSGQRKSRVKFLTTKRLETLKRVDRLRQELQKQSWNDKAELLRMGGSLELTIQDQMEQDWEITILRSPNAPSKPTRPRTLKTTRKLKVRIEDNGDEVLTSASESEPFVTDDDLDMDDWHSAQEPEPLDFDSSILSIVTEDLDMVDLSEMPASPTPENVEVPTPRTQKNEPCSPATAPTRPLPETPTTNRLRHAFSTPGRSASRGRKDIAPDPRSLLLGLMDTLSQSVRRKIVAYVNQFDNHELWKTFILRATGQHDDLAEDVLADSPAARIDTVAMTVSRLFDAFCSTSSAPSEAINEPLTPGVTERITFNRGRWDAFVDLLREIPIESPESDPAPATPSRAQRTGNAVEDSSDEDVPPSSLRRRRKVKRDAAAEKLREKDVLHSQQQEERMLAMRRQVASGNLSEKDFRVIINAAKDEGHGLVAVHPTIAPRIKDHQVEGVRFMWNQLCRSDSSRQGCLLAHTMGLGKTMQVITLLVAIAEASGSADPTIYEQIPLEIRESKTLVLCPAGLVDNWVDELARWSPEGLLGAICSVASVTSAPGRSKTVRKWNDRGGVLIIGYNMFKRLVGEADADADEETSGKLEESDLQLKSILHDSPTIVVADEAHYLKNPNSQVTQATSKFKTWARIAMTGSPLANNVEEYHSMIDWVAPNYLGSHKEFASIYSGPINRGLYQDSTRQDRRESLKMLRVLKDTVALKIHRKTMASLRYALSPKTEFILFLPLHPLQKQAYQELMQVARRTLDGNAQLWKFIAQAALLLAHPQVFLQRIPQWKKDEKNPWIIEKLNTLEKMLNKTGIDHTKYSPKVQALLVILDEARKVKDKVLIFSQSLETLNYLEALFRIQQRAVCRLDGKTQIKHRQDMVKNFNTSYDEIFLISTAAGGVGLNIWGANRVVLFDFQWNPVIQQQAIGRAYRIGQTKPVFVYWLVVGGTFETKLLEQGVFKTQLASRVVDKANPKAFAQKKTAFVVDPVDIPQESLEAFHGRDVILDAVIAPQSNAGGALLVRKAITTETFEEEEPESQLTPEEIAETKKIIVREQMRLRNPQEYARLLLKEEQDRLLEQQRLMAAARQRSAAAPPQAQIPPPGPPQQAANPAMTPVPLVATPSSARPASQPPVATSSSAAPALPGLRFIHTKHPSPATGTASSPAVSSPGPSAQAPSQRQIHALQPSEWGFRTQQEFKEYWLKIVAQKSAAGRPLFPGTGSRDKFTKNLIADIWSALACKGVSGKVLVMAAWKRIPQALDNETRFPKLVEQIVARHILPEHLVQEPEKLEEALSQNAKADAKPLANGRPVAKSVGAQPAAKPVDAQPVAKPVDAQSSAKPVDAKPVAKPVVDPNHIEANVHRVKQGLETPTQNNHNVHRIRDLMAMQDVVDKRKKNIRYRPSTTPKPAVNPQQARPPTATPSETSRAGDNADNPFFID